MFAASNRLNILRFFLFLLRRSIFAVWPRQLTALLRCVEFLRRLILGQDLGWLVGPIVNRGV